MPENDLSRRAVVTGLGAVTPIGNDHPTFWRNLVAGDERRRTHHPLRRQRLRRAHRGRGQGLRPDDRDGPQDGPPDEPLHPPRHGRRQGGRRATRVSTSPTGRLERRDRVAVAVNTSGGGLEQVIDGTAVLHDEGPALRQPVRHPGPVGLDGGLPAVDGVRPDGPGHHPGRRLRQLGHRFLDALRMIQRGEVDVVLAGGSEAPLLPIGFAALGNMGALSKRNDDPEHASRPFDRDRDGFVFGEGAGVVVVESPRSTRSRAARRSTPRSSARR